MVGKSEQPKETDNEGSFDGLFFRVPSSSEQGGERLPEDPGTGKVQWQEFFTMQGIYQAITGLKPKEWQISSTVGKWMQSITGRGETHGHHHEARGPDVGNISVREALRLAKESARAPKPPSPPSSRVTANPLNEEKHTHGGQSHQHEAHGPDVGEMSVRDALRLARQASRPSATENKVNTKSSAPIPISEAHHRMHAWARKRGLKGDELLYFHDRNLVPAIGDSDVLVDRAIFHRLAENLWLSVDGLGEEFSGETMSLRNVAQLLGVTLDEMMRSGFDGIEIEFRDNHCFCKADRLQAILVAITNLTDEQIAETRREPDDDSVDDDSKEIQLIEDKSDSSDGYMEAILEEDESAELNSDVFNQPAPAEGDSFSGGSRWKALDSDSGLPLDDSREDVLSDDSSIFKFDSDSGINLASPSSRDLGDVPENLDEHIQVLRNSRKFWLTAEEAARFLKISVTRLRDMEAANEIRGGLILDPDDREEFRTSDVIDLLTKRKKSEEFLLSPSDEMFLDKDEEFLLSPSDEMFNDAGTSAQLDSDMELDSDDDAIDPDLLEDDDEPLDLEDLSSTAGQASTIEATSRLSPNLSWAPRQSHQFIGLDEAARIIGVTREQLIEMRSNGEIRGFRDGERWRFKEDEVGRVRDEMVEKNSVVSEADQVPDLGGDSITSLELPEDELDDLDNW